MQRQVYIQKLSLPTSIRTTVSEPFNFRHFQHLFMAKGYLCLGYRPATSTISAFQFWYLAETYSRPLTIAVYATGLSCWPYLAQTADYRSLWIWQPVDWPFSSGIGEGKFTQSFSQEFFLASLYAARVRRCLLLICVSVCSVCSSESLHTRLHLYLLVCISVYSPAYLYLLLHICLSSPFSLAVRLHIFPRIYLLMRIFIHLLLYLIGRIFSPHELHVHSHLHLFSTWLKLLCSLHRAPCISGALMQSLTFLILRMLWFTWYDLTGSHVQR